MDFNKLAVEIYEQNKAVGWWDNPDRCLFECLQLVSTEVAEATEGERKDLMDDHLPARKMGEVELADALIRALDLGGRMGWEYADYSIAKKSFSNWSAGRRHFLINRHVCKLGDALDPLVPPATPIHVRYSLLVRCIEEVADSFGYDLEGAVVEKLAYNKTRADHTRENRAEEGGKKF